MRMPIVSGDGLLGLAFLGFFSILLLTVSPAGASMLEVADLVTHPDQYDKQMVVVVGRVSTIQTAENKQGQSAYGFLLKDGNGTVKVIGMGRTDVHEGEQVVVEGFSIDYARRVAPSFTTKSKPVLFGLSIAFIRTLSAETVVTNPHRSRSSRSAIRPDGSSRGFPASGYPPRAEILQILPPIFSPADAVQFGHRSRHHGGAYSR